MTQDEFRAALLIEQFSTPVHSKATVVHRNINKRIAGSSSNDAQLLAEIMERRKELTRAMRKEKPRQ